MAKADYSRDYYADLDLPPNADINDIKKQFRKLALKYHPDRNPGRENEVNARFQTIQSAHEILTNPEQKAKYDAQRARRYPTASNIRGNPYANFGRGFPPPPKRNPQPSSSYSQKSTGPSSADRYSRFTGNAPPPPPRPREDPKAAAEAFASMRPKPKAPTAAAASSKGSSRTAAAEPSASTRPTPKPPTAAAPDPRQTAYTASQQKKAEASFGNRTGRGSTRSGFVPDSPMGDEPPVVSSNYMTGRRHTTLSDQAPPPVPPREPAHYSNWATPADDGLPPNLDPRSSPYQRHSGERLNIFEGTTPVNRAKSTREGHRRTDDESDPFTTQNHRQRSFSVSNESEKATNPPSEPRRSHSSRPPAAAAAAAGHTPDSPRTSRFDERYGAGRFGASAAEHDGSRRAFPGNAKSDETVFSPDAGGARDSPHFAGKRADSINTSFVPEEHANVDWQFNGGGDFGPNAGGAGVRRAQTSAASGRRSPTKSRSRMAAAGVAAGATAAAAAAAGAFGKGGPEPAGSSSDEGPDGTRAEARHQEHQTAAGFDAQDWDQKIGSEHFVPVVPPRSTGSPSRPMRPVKRRPTIRMTKGGSAGLVVEEDDTTSGEDRWAGAAHAADSASAMDIDTPMGDAADYAPPPAAAENGVRSVPLEPSRPEWRAGNANGFVGVPPMGVQGGGGVGGVGGPDGVSNSAPATVAATPDAVDVKPRFNVSNTAGSEDTDELRTNLGDFKNVEPIAQRPAGLGSFDDLKSNLPFESRASARAPVERSSRTKPASAIEFPKAPMPPRPPPTLAVAGLHTNKETWEGYAAAFEVYLSQWDDFNSRFVDHVLARQNQLAKMKRKAGGGQQSSIYTGSEQSMRDYLDWLEQDQQVHEKWTLHHADHIKCVREFMAHRDKMRET